MPSANKKCSWAALPIHINLVRSLCESSRSSRSPTPHSKQSVSEMLKTPYFSTRWVSFDCANTRFSVKELGFTPTTTDILSSTRFLRMLVLHRRPAPWLAESRPPLWLLQLLPRRNTRVRAQTTCTSKMLATRLVTNISLYGFSW